MSRNNADIIKIVPVPKHVFTSNTLIVADPIDDNESNYNHVGKYIASSSSYSSEDRFAKNAFNPISDSFWQCDYADNSNYNKHTFAYKEPYKYNPYIKAGDGPSIYRPIGGGVANTTMTTWVNQDNKKTIISGEWLQVQIPDDFAVHLFKYSILTPTPINNVITFPKSFLVVGSLDGTAWDIIDQQVTQDDMNTADRKPRVFNINSTKKYTYFRLIITSLFKGMDIVSINQWALYGTALASVNRDAFTGMPAPMKTVPVAADNVWSLSKNRPALIYDSYKPSRPLLSHEPILPVIEKEPDYIYMSIPVLVTTLLLIALFTKYA